MLTVPKDTQWRILTRPRTEDGHQGAKVLEGDADVFRAVVAEYPCLCTGIPEANEKGEAMSSCWHIRRFGPDESADEQVYTVSLLWPVRIEELSTPVSSSVRPKYLPMHAAI